MARACFNESTGQQNIAFSYPPELQVVSGSAESLALNELSAALRSAGELLPSVLSVLQRQVDAQARIMETDIPSVQWIMYLAHIEPSAIVAYYRGQWHFQKRLPREVSTAEFLDSFGDSPRSGPDLWLTQLAVLSEFAVTDFLAGSESAMLLTESEAQLWNSLAGLSGTAKEWATILDTSEDAIRQLVKQLKHKGRVVENKRGVGYFRPDALPQQD